MDASIATHPKNNFFYSTWFYSIAIGLLIFLQLLEISPYTHGPSPQEYINFSPFRPPVYPYFIWLFHWLGGGQFIAVMWAQSILNFIVLLYAGYWLRSRLQLSPLLIFIIFLLPVEVFFIRFSMLESIRSEALSFPLFIITFTLLIDCFKKFNKLKLLYLVIAGNLLILTREQFCYFYCLFFLLPIWWYWQQKQLQKALFAFGTIAVSILIAMSLNQLYHYKVHHRLQGSNLIGFTFIDKALYFATPGDVKYFNDPEEINLFTQAINKFQENHLSYWSSPKAPLPLELANRQFNQDPDLTRDTLLSVFPGGETDYKTSKLLLNMSKVLFFHSYKKNIIFALYSTAVFAGGIYIFSSILIIILAMTLYFYINRYKSQSIDDIFIYMSLLIIVANAALVSFTSHYELRYFYYSYFLYFCLAGLMVKKFFTLRQG